MRAHRVRALLMGGQARVLYGAAEFSRDADLAVDAVTIAVPPFEAQYLERGHAMHFRCGMADAAGLRVDVMSRMHGVDVL